MKGDGGIRLSKKSPYWQIYYSLRGEQFRESTKVVVVHGAGLEAEKSRREAEKILRARLKQVHADQIGARKFVGPKIERLTVNQILDALVADFEVREKYRASTHSQIKPLRAAFGDRPAASVTDADVQRFIRDLRARGKRNATINRSMGLLDRAYRMNKILAHDRPMIPRLSEADNVRRGFVESDLFEEVVARLPEDVQDFARWGYLTGWRKGTISKLDWTTVDLREMKIDVPGSMTKNGKPQKMPLTPDLREIIERRLAARTYKRLDGTDAISALVFYRAGGKGVQPGSPVADFDKVWIPACQEAGVGKLLFHDLRRSAVRNLKRAGIDDSVAMRITGHRTNSMFQRYNIVDDSDLEAAMRKLETYVKKARTSNVRPFIRK